MRRGVAAGFGGLALLVAPFLGCGAADPAPTTATPSGAGKRAKQGQTFGLPRTWPRSMLLPDLDPARVADASSPEGAARLVGRMRVLVRENGVVERARDLLPVGRVSSLPLPGRLGGGFVFISATGRGTEIWRAATWLAPLSPVASLGPAADMDRPLVAGFDRLYVRLRSGDLYALDPSTGATVGYGALPPAAAYGDMVFLDGWRAVVDADLRGPLATFDAGATWRPVTLPARLRSLGAASRDPDAGGDAVLAVDGAVYTLSARGDLSLSASAPTQPAATGTPFAFATPPGVRGPSHGPAPTEDASDRSATPPGPLGRRPLRLALERGYPESAEAAVVAHEGSLVRVALSNGAIQRVRPGAYPDRHASCHGIALGQGDGPPIGFLCGVPDGPTIIYGLTASFELAPVMRFAGPRAVVESGQGGLVVRGPCGEEAAPEGVRPFCVRSPDGATREVRVRGEVGSERVIALADGRVVILVPPRVGAQGQLSVLEGSRSKHTPVKVPDGAPREVETGMWLEGFHQTGPNTIAGWVEAGGPTFGVEVSLGGALTVGPVVSEPNGVLVSGRFGVAVGSEGKLLETTDTGKTWTEAALPALPSTDTAEETRRCGPVGCALDGWLRVGWGEPALAEDLREAPQPEPPKLGSFKLSSAPVSLACHRGRTTARRTDASRAPAALGESPTGWLPFLGVSPPPLAKDEVGFDAGDAFAANPVRAYVWGKRDSDWTRTGRFVVRFQDDLSLEPVRSSAVSRSPWATTEAARDAFGAGSFGMTWFAFRDHGGSAALVATCRGATCSIFSVEAGSPALALRPVDRPALGRPLPQSAVKVGPSWFYLADDGGADRVGLFRTDLGRSQLLSSLPRPVVRGGPTTAAPRLVRRAKGAGLGLTFVVKEGPLDRRGVRYVLPVDAETGAIGDAVRLGRADLGDVVLSGGCGSEDGWLVDLTQGDVAFDVDLDGRAASLESVVAVVRWDGASACVDGIAASTQALSTDGGAKSAQKGGAPPAPPGRNREIPVFVADRATGERALLLCRTRVR